MSGQSIGLTIAALSAAAVASSSAAPRVSGGVGGDEPDGALANVTEMELEFAGPGDLPGRAPGPHARPTPLPAPAKPSEPAAAPPSARDWFGHKPFWEWSGVTGDWGGVRTSLEDIGLTFAGSYTLDWMSVWSGGLRNRASTRSLFDVSLTLDTDKAFGLPGGTAYVDFQSSDMRGGTEDTGAFMAPSSIETGDNIDQVSELWYQQLFADGLVRVKAGKIDAGLEFAYSSASENFLHQSNVFLFTSTLVPTYPDPAMGAAIFLYPTETIYLAGGFFDGSLSEGVHTGRHGPAPLFDGDEYLWIAEAGITWDSLGALGSGKFAAGGWGHSGEFETSDGSIDDGTGAGYFTVQQRLLARENAEPDSEAGLVVFAFAGFADGDVSDAQTQVTAGLTLNGTFEGRDDDSAGFLVTWLDLSNDRGFAQNETAVELMYRFQLTPFATLTPALQYVANPSGDESTDDALVGAVRFELDF